MYNLTFTKEQFELIGECVLATIQALNKTWEQMPLRATKAGAGIQEQIAACNAILRELAKIEEEAEDE